MLRAILALLFAILYLIIGIPVLFVEWIIGKFNRQAADISQLRMVQWAFRVILFICGTRLTIIGEENVPKDQPVLYIGNHRSYFSAPEKMAAAAIGFAAFSLSASAIYALNDCRDAPQDRQHPRKKNRPVAAGRISERAALTMALALAVLSAGILLAGRGMIAQFGAAAATLAAYLLMNVCYTVFGLKHVPILDVSIVALGFVMRILFGSFLTGIPVSSWLLLTVMVASYYMSFGKRRNELRALGQNSVRRVLSLYTPEFLTQSTNMFLTLTIVFYALWSVDAQTELRYAQGRAVWSLPLVILILLFYHYDIDTQPDGDPVEIILHDWRLVVLACVYVAMMLLLM